MKLLTTLAAALLLTVSTAHAGDNLSRPAAWEDFSYAEVALTCAAYHYNIARAMATRPDYTDGDAEDAMLMFNIWQAGYTAEQYRPLVKRAATYVGKHWDEPTATEHVRFCTTQGQKVYSRLSPASAKYAAKLARDDYTAMLKSL
jgi:hypothetical protein